MSARAEEEIIPTPIDNPMPAELTDAEKLSAPGIAAPMLDVHAPHESIQTWENFFIHIATIVIRLFIPVGIEQTVEVFHHRHLSEQLEEQMREVFTIDLQSDALALQQLSNLRAYLLQLRV